MLDRVLTDIGDAALWTIAGATILFFIQQFTMEGWRTFRSTFSFTIVGEMFCLLQIIVPSLMALADPADFARFAGTTWYRYWSVEVVVLAAAFTLSRNAAWEYVRRNRSKLLRAQRDALNEELTARGDADG